MRKAVLLAIPAVLQNVDKKYLYFCLKFRGKMIIRGAIDALKSWYSREHRKPLLIRGARQVGKTTLVRMFSEIEHIQLIESPTSCIARGLIVLLSYIFFNNFFIKTHGTGTIALCPKT